MRSQHTQLVVYVDYDMRYSRPFSQIRHSNIKKVLLVSQMCRVYSLDVVFGWLSFKQKYTHKHAHNAARTKPNAKTINFQLFRNEAYSTFCSSHWAHSQSSRSISFQASSSLFSSLHRKWILKAIIFKTLHYHHEQYNRLSLKKIAKQSNFVHPSFAHTHTIARHFRMESVIPSPFQLIGFIVGWAFRRRGKSTNRTFGRRR